MMAELVRPMISPPKVLSDSREVLGQNLDDLLERYLTLLHQYHSLQQTLSKQLSSGFLELAQANFSNPNRIRYGQDFYDERMQASTQLTINGSNEVLSIDSPCASTLQDEYSSVLDGRKTLSTTSASEGLCEPEKAKNRAQALPDPLRWFGVLVPPALRSSQASFKDAVINSMPALANINAEMREVEIEVRRTRKRLSKLQ